MSRLAFILLAAGALSAALVCAEDTAVGHSPIERMAIAALEKFRSSMKTADNFFKRTLDPFVVEKHSVGVHVKEVTLDGSVSNLAVSGLSAFDLRTLSIVLVDGTVGIALDIPAIDVVGDYDLLGSVKKGIVNLPIEGKGKLTAGVSDLSVSTSISLGISSPDGQIVVDDFSLSYWNLSDAKVHLGGLYDDSNLGNMINNILADSLDHLLRAYHSQITTLVTKAVRDAASNFLADLHKDSHKPSIRLPDIRHWFDHSVAVAGKDAKSGSDDDDVVLTQLGDGSSKSLEEAEDGDDDEDVDENDDDDDEEEDEADEIVVNKLRLPVKDDEGHFHGGDYDEEEEDEADEDRDLAGVRLLGKPRFFQHDTL